MGKVYPPDDIDDSITDTTHTPELQPVFEDILQELLHGECTFLQHCSAEQLARWAIHFLGGEASEPVSKARFVAASARAQIAQVADSIDLGPPQQLTGDNRSVELMVRHRTGALLEPLLYDYGFAVHACLYPLTFLLGLTSLPAKIIQLLLAVHNFFFQFTVSGFLKATLALALLPVNVALAVLGCIMGVWLDIAGIVLPISFRWACNDFHISLSPYDDDDSIFLGIGMLEFELLLPSCTAFSIAFACFGPRGLDFVFCYLGTGVHGVWDYYLEVLLHGHDQDIHHRFTQKDLENLCMCLRRAPTQTLCDEEGKKALSRKYSENLSEKFRSPRLLGLSDSDLTSVRTDVAIALARAMVPPSLRSHLGPTSAWAIVLGDHQLISEFHRLAHSCADFGLNEIRRAAWLPAFKPLLIERRLAKFDEPEILPTEEAAVVEQAFLLHELIASVDWTVETHSQLQTFGHSS